MSPKNDSGKIWGENSKAHLTYVGRLVKVLAVNCLVGLDDGRYVDKAACKIPSRGFLQQVNHIQININYHMRTHLTFIVDKSKVLTKLFYPSNCTWPLLRYCVLAVLSGSSWINSLSFRLVAWKSFIIPKVQTKRKSFFRNVPHNIRDSAGGVRCIVASTTIVEQFLTHPRTDGLSECHCRLLGQPHHKLILQLNLWKHRSMQTTCKGRLSFFLWNLWGKVT